MKITSTNNNEATTTTTASIPYDNNISLPNKNRKNFLSSQFRPILIREHSCHI